MFTWHCTRCWNGHKDEENLRNNQSSQGNKPLNKYLQYLKKLSSKNGTECCGNIEKISLILLRKLQKRDSSRKNNCYTSKSLGV